MYNGGPPGCGAATACRLPRIEDSRREASLARLEPPGNFSVLERSRQMQGLVGSVKNFDKREGRPRTRPALREILYLLALLEPTSHGAACEQPDAKEGECPGLRNGGYRPANVPGAR